MLNFCFVFFFFQAEDGIRYLTVTGVQTCALPISSVTSPSAKTPIVTLTHTVGVFALGLVTLALSQWIVPDTLYPWIDLTARSEERRVGKECRYRWSADPYKRKKTNGVL